MKKMIFALLILFCACAYDPPRYGVKVANFTNDTLFYHYFNKNFDNCNFELNLYSKVNDTTMMHPNISLPQDTVTISLGFKNFMQERVQISNEFLHVFPLKDIQHIGWPKVCSQRSMYDSILLTNEAVNHGLTLQYY